MSKPVLYAISAFDATQEHIFTFSFSGGQIINVNAKIYNNETGAVVYNGTYTTQKPQFLLPAWSIKNSEIPYNIEIRIYTNTNGGEYSEFSDKYQFYCITTPTFKFKNLSVEDKNTISDSTTSLSIEYKSVESENEQLDSYQYFLYSAAKVVIDKSEVFYSLGKSFAISYLSNDTDYYVRATGVTKNGMRLDTGFIHIYADYVVSVTYLAVEPVNRKRYGDIVVKSNVVSIDGFGVPDPMQYLTEQDVAAGENKYRTGVVLANYGDYIIFNENFTLQSEFDMELVMMRMYPNRRIVTLRGENGSIELYMCQRKLDSEESTSTYVILIDKDAEYTVQSNKIVYEEGYLTISLKRQGGLFDIHIQNSANSAPDDLNEDEQYIDNPSSEVVW